MGFISLLKKGGVTAHRDFNLTVSSTVLIPMKVSQREFCSSVLLEIVQVSISVIFPSKNKLYSCQASVLIWFLF